jgi:hypothetical protein
VWLSGKGNLFLPSLLSTPFSCSRLRLKCDGTSAETRFGLSPKRTSPFKSAGASVHSTTGSRGVCISGSNAGYTMFRGSVRVLATHSIRQFPLHFPSRASPCAIRFQTHSASSDILLTAEGIFHPSNEYHRCFVFSGNPCSLPF